MLSMGRLQSRLEYMLQRHKEGVDTSASQPLAHTNLLFMDEQYAVSLFQVRDRQKYIFRIFVHLCGLSRGKILAMISGPFCQVAGVHTSVSVLSGGQEECGQCDIFRGCTR
jgi:hypothetical protein